MTQLTSSIRGSWFRERHVHGVPEFLRRWNATPTLYHSNGERRNCENWTRNEDSELRLPEEPDPDPDDELELWSELLCEELELAELPEELPEELDELLELLLELMEPPEPDPILEPPPELAPPPSE